MRSTQELVQTAEYQENNARMGDAFAALNVSPLQATMRAVESREYARGLRRQIAFWAFVTVAPIGMAVLFVQAVA